MKLYSFFIFLFINCFIHKGIGMDMDMDMEITLSPSLEYQREEIQAAFIDARNWIANYAKNNNWHQYTYEPFIESAKIFDSKEAFDNAVKEHLKMDMKTSLPEALSAILEDQVFMSVSPQVYSQIYPDGVEINSFEKLITHEIAHRLHTRILKGNENAMGPVWFFEGFAIIVANQFNNSAPTLDEEEIWNIVESDNRGSYIKYRSVMNYFLGKTEISEMIKKASNMNFTKWLREL